MTSKLSNIVLFTSQEVGYLLVEALVARDDISLLVITQRTKRDDINGYRSAADACKAHNIPCILSGRVDEFVKSRIRLWEPAIILSAYYPVKIPPDVISVAAGGAINVHPGILPRYRGRYPTPWYILNGEKEFGIALHRLDAGIDTGDVLVQETFPIGRMETGAELYRKAMAESAKLLVNNLSALLQNQLLDIPQKGSGSYYSSIERRHHIDWNQSREQIMRRIRVHARPYFPAYSFLYNRILLINRATPIDPPGYVAQGVGRIVDVLESNCLIVSCSDGCLCVEDFCVSPPFESGEETLHFQPGNQLD